MASSRISPSRQPTQLSAAAASSQPQYSERLAVLNYHTNDPLLGNLSPESTLQALSSINAVPKNEQAAHDILAKSISQVSPAERALGIRAAVAAQKLVQWYKEVQAWEWPKRTDIHLGKGFIPPSMETESEYCGSLPVAVVEEHEERIEEIRDGMDNLGVEELKEHILNAHIPARSRPSSSNSTISIPPPLSYVQLSDFTAVITATILRALPFLSRLNSLLSTWGVRLLVLRQIPALLRSLNLARCELNSALDLLKSPDIPTEHHPLYSITNYHAKRTALESTVVSTGRIMDRILDALEGREDSLPEQWIDDLEAIESEFGTWVMQAEKRTVENEWLRLTASTKKNVQTEVLTPMTTTEVVTTAREPEARDLEPQSRLAPLQTGRTPMETIVEEILSPVEPKQSITADDMEDAPSMRTITTPSSEDQSPLLPDCIDRDETLAITSIISTGAACIAATAADTSQNGIGAEVDINSCNADKPLVEETSPLFDEFNEAPATATYTHEISPISSKGEEAPTPSANVQSEEFPSESLQLETKCDIRPDCPLDPEPIRDEQVSPVEEIASPSLSVDASQGIPPSQDANVENVVPQAFNHPSELPHEKHILSSEEVEFSRASDELEPIAEVDDQSQLTTAEDGCITPASAASKKAAGSEILPRPVSPLRTGTPPPHTVTPLLDSPDLFVPFDSSKASADKKRQPEEPEKPDDGNPPKQHLESPIKLSKSRPGRLDLDAHSSKPRVRRTSIGSNGSLSDYPSLVSSPEIHEPRTSSSGGTPILLETPPHFSNNFQSSDSVPQNRDHTLREDRLFRLDVEKASPREAFAHNRTLSLPLQRFINERLELNYEPGSVIEEENFTSGKNDSDAPAHLTSQNGQKEPKERHQKARSSAPATNNMRILAGQHLALTREESSGRESTRSSREPLKKSRDHGKRAVPKNPEQAGHVTTARLKKQLTAHPSLESIGAYKSNTRLSEELTTKFEKNDSRSSTPNSHLIRAKDQMDEKINSILTSLPARIHLVPADQDDDAISVTSSIPFKSRERFRSHSPLGTPSRSSTPTPSLTLRPAISRRRHSHAHAPEESSVKLYHLHRGGKSAPTKLFVRSVGENGERVMVRVGGGWADLGEYLREYAIHHGRRHVSETPRVEVEGLSSRESPSYSPPGTRLTPSRPRSVLSNRPSSSLAVRKTRRASNVSDITEFRPVGAVDAVNVSISPKSAVFPRRRLSVSSNVSAGAMSSISELRHGSPSTIAAGGASHAMPLGLAGPKPRAKHASISPESEAWVEDVLGQARRSSSLRPFKFGLPPLENESESTVPALPKARSISDIGKAGSSKRVALRGLGNR